MFYIFHGEDTHTQKERLNDVISKLGDPSMLELNTTKLEGRGLTLGMLQDACNAMPFLAPKRVVIVEDLLTSKPDKKLLDGLKGYLPQMPDTARLFLLESKGLSSKNAMVKLADSEKNGYQKLFDRPQGAQLERWIIQRTADLGGQMHPRAANMLAVNVGNSLSLLDQEIQKLVMYKGITEPIMQITAEDVAVMSPYAAEANIFDLVDAIGNRNGQRAAVLLTQKLAEGAEPFMIFSMIVRQFRLLIQVKELADTGMRPPEISKELRMHSFVAGKIYQQAQSFSMAQLERIHAHLLDVDVQVKTGKTDMVTALNMLVFGLVRGKGA